MRKILLTSAGFENEVIQRTFLQMAGKPPEALYALFIPTAAIDAAAIAVLPKCMNDLLKIGMPAGHITVYDLHKPMTDEEISRFDAVYFCGGNSAYLLERVNENGFNEVLERFADAGGIYVGVSAGSWIATRNLENNLGYIHCTLGVHKPVGSSLGYVDTADCPHIDLTDNQAIMILGDVCQIIGY